MAYAAMPSVVVIAFYRFIAVRQYIWFWGHEGAGRKAMRMNQAMPRVVLVKAGEEQKPRNPRECHQRLRNVREAAFNVYLRPTAMHR